MSDFMYDVRKEQYTTIIREMIRHENDVTNHRIMWLLIGQGLLANAFIIAGRGSAAADSMLSLVGILGTLSALGMLYKSYRARGYLEFLGQQAKQGTLQEEHLPLVGWPRKRIKGWWREVWVCPWISQAGDMLEPWLFLPSLLTFMWLLVLLQRLGLNSAVSVILAVILTAVIISVCFILLVRSQGKDEECAEEQARASKTDGDGDPVV